MKRFRITEKQFNKIKKNKVNENERALNYMFFQNLEQLKRQAELLLDIDKNQINTILEDGHDWAEDHISSSKENLDQVFDFLMNKVNEWDKSDLAESVESFIEPFLNERVKPGRGKPTTNLGGTTTSSSGSYVKPIGKGNGKKPNISGGYDDYESPGNNIRISFPPQGDGDGDTEPIKPPSNNRKPVSMPITAPTYGNETGSFTSTLKRSTMCCKKCKNGKFKHECDDEIKSPNLKFDKTGCIYETITDCQLNKKKGKKGRKKLGEQRLIENKSGKNCADTEKGCIRKRKSGWVILNNKKGGVWRKCDSKKHCEEILDAFHASK
jgi:hypothetical protein